MFIDVDGLRVAVEQIGAGPHTLLLHGWGTSARSLTPVMRVLASSYTVTALDFPGFGLSLPPSEPWDTYRFAEFVRRAMLRLGIERTHLIGHSHGGRVSIILAAESPALIERLVLIDSAGIRPPRTLRLRLRGLVARGGRRLLGHHLAGVAGRRALATLYTRLGMTDYRDAGSLRQTFVRVVNQDLTALLPRIQAPALIVWGARDEETPLWMGEQMARTIPGAELLVLPQGGHFAYLDERDVFERALLRFLAGEPVAVA